MKLNFSKQLSIGALLIMSTAIVGCVDDGTSVREFGTGALSTSTTSSTDLPATIEFEEASLVPDEHLSGAFAFHNGSESYVWMEAELLSGPDIEVHMMDTIEIERWAEAASTGYANHEFIATYPDLSGRISGNLRTDKIVVASGGYNLVLDNTTAGVVQPDESGEESIFNFRLYIEAIASDGTTSVPADVQVFSLTKVRVISQKH